MYCIVMLQYVTHPYFKGISITIMRGDSIHYLQLIICEQGCTSGILINSGGTTPINTRCMLYMV